MARLKVKGIQILQETTEVMQMFVGPSNKATMGSRLYVES